MLCMLKLVWCMMLKLRWFDLCLKLCENVSCVEIVLVCVVVMVVLVIWLFECVVSRVSFMVNMEVMFNCFDWKICWVI